MQHTVKWLFVTGVLAIAAGVVIVCGLQDSTAFEPPPVTAVNAPAPEPISPALLAGPNGQAGTNGVAEAPEELDEEPVEPGDQEAAALQQQPVTPMPAITASVVWTYHGGIVGSRLPVRTVHEIPSGILVDVGSGRILWSKSSTTPLQIASMTKMMTVLLAMEAVDRGEITLDTRIRVTRDAAEVGGSQVYLKEGEEFSLIDLLKSVMIASANDSAHLVAVRLEGSAQAFVKRMNERARQLGMQHTRFYNPHGLPYRSGKNVGSALDMAKLALTLMRYPLVFKWSSTWTDSFRDGTFTLQNHNPLVKLVPGVDGLKTGYYSTAGYSVTVTAHRGGRRLIAVIIGVRTKAARNAFGRDLIEWGFRQVGAGTQVAGK
ncbi:D-alanyl-D-alanine carboxypeptidase [bacterium]|nr:D-alanyl-D-alanine carboxypeptidase [bacterium]